MGDPILAALLVVCAAWAIALVARWPWLALLAIVLLIPFNGYVSQAHPGIAVAYGPAKDAALAALLLSAAAHGALRLVPGPVRAFVWVFVWVGVIAMLRTPDLLQGLYGWRNDFYPLLLLVAAPGVLSERTARTLTKAIVGVAQLAALVTLYTWRQGLDWMFTVGLLPANPVPYQYFLSGSQQPRGFSPYSAPNEAGLACAIVVAVALTAPGWTWRQRILGGALPLLALATTQSRSAILGVVVLAFAVLAIRASRRPSGLAPVALPVLGIVGVVGLALVTSSAKTARDTSFAGHAKSLARLPELVSQYPFGSGAGTVGPRAARYDGVPILIENFWGVLAVEASIVALFAYLPLLLWLTRKGLTSRAPGALMVPAVIAASLVSQLVLPTLQEGAVSYLLWTSVSIGLFWALRPPSGAEPLGAVADVPAGRPLSERL